MPGLYFSHGFLLCCQDGELDAVKAVFNEKEKELAMAVARVDRLNRQLQELRNGNNNTGGGALDNKQAAVAAELEKLRKELLVRKAFNFDSALFLI